MFRTKKGENVSMKFGHEKKRKKKRRYINLSKQG